MFQAGYQAVVTMLEPTRAQVGLRREVLPAHKVKVGVFKRTDLERNLGLEVRQRLLKITSNDHKPEMPVWQRDDLSANPRRGDLPAITSDQVTPIRQ